GPWPGAGCGDEWLLRGWLEQGTELCTEFLLIEEDMSADADAGDIASVDAASDRRLGGWGESHGFGDGQESSALAASSTVRYFAISSTAIMSSPPRASDWPRNKEDRPCELLLSLL